MTGRYKAYSEYKDSGVDWFGDIPSAWKFLSLKRNFKIVNGSTPRSSEASFWDGDITWVTPADLSKVDVHISGSSKNITNKGLSSCGTSLVPKGSLILSTRAPIGTIAIASKELCTNQGCKSLVLYNNVDSKFYYYVISVSGKQLNNLGRGTTFLELSTDELSNFAVPTPSFTEQQKIASFLDHETAKIDTLIAKQEKLIELLKEKRQAVISHAVTKGLNPNAPMRDSGVEWLGEVPEHWSVKKLSSSSKITRLAGYEYTAYWKATESGEIIAIRGQNIRFNKLIELNKAERISSSLSERLWRSKLSRNDIAYPCVGTIGNAVLIEEDDKYHINQNIAKLTPTDRVHPLFLTYFLNSKVCLESALFLNTSDAQPSVLVGNLRRVKIAIPQREEQILISKYLQQQLKKLEDINDKTLLTINLMKERKTALISAAVTGKIDVRDFVSEQGQPQGVQG